MILQLFQALQWGRRILPTNRGNLQIGSIIIPRNVIQAGSSCKRLNSKGVSRGYIDFSGSVL
jgi:hypothetical protein